MRWNRHLGTALLELPPRNEVLELASIQPRPATIERRVLCRHLSLVPVNTGKDHIQGVGHPIQLGRRNRHSLDRERTVRSLVPTAEAIRLQPTGERRLGDRALRDLPVSPGVRAMPRQLVADLELAGGDKTTRVSSARPPD